MEGIKLRVRTFDLEIGRFQVTLHQGDAEELGVHAQDRVKVANGMEPVTAVVDTTDSMLARGEIGVFEELKHRFELEEGDILTVFPAERPQSVNSIKKKMQNKRLDKEEIDQIVADVVDGTLTDIELAAWVTTLEINEMEMEEVEHLTRAMVKFGETLDFVFGVALTAAVNQRLRQLRPLAARAQVAHRQIVRDAQQPRHEGRASDLITLNRHPRLEEGLRRQVLGLRRLANHVVDVPVHAHDVAVVQRAERLTIATDRAAYERKFVDL